MKYSVISFHISFAKMVVVILESNVIIVCNLCFITERRWEKLLKEIYTNFIRGVNGKEISVMETKHKNHFINRINYEDNIQHDMGQNYQDEKYVLFVSLFGSFHPDLESK